MTLREISFFINSEEFDKKYMDKSEVSSLISNLITCYSNGDESLSSVQRYLDMHYYMEDAKARSHNDLVKDMINMFRDILINKVGLCNKDDIFKIIEFCSQNGINQSELVRDYFRVIVAEDEESIKELVIKVVSLPEEADVSNDDFALLIHLLKGRNKLNVELLKFILEHVDIWNFGDGYFDITQYTEEERKILFDYDCRLIDGMKEEMITDDMIQKVGTDEKYCLNNKTPAKVLNNRNILKALIRRDPNRIKGFPEYMGDSELMGIALDSGMQVTDDVYRDYNVLNTDYVLQLIRSEGSKIEVNGIVTLKLILPGDERKEKVNVFEIINECAKRKMFTPEIFEAINESNVFSVFNGDPMVLKDFLANRDYVFPCIKSLKNCLANQVTFEIDQEFIDAFYENGYTITNNASEQVRNSKELYVRAFQYDANVIGCTIKYGKDEFLTLELLKKALEKGLNPLLWDIQNVTDRLLQDEVHDLLLVMLDPSYKEIIERIISKAGCTIFYMEKDNILSYEVVKVFGEDLVTKIIRNLVIPGEQIDFRSLIANKKVEEFRYFYLNFKTNDDVRQLKFLYDAYNDNQELVKDILSNGMTEAEDKAFREYIYQKGKFFRICNRKFLKDIANDCYITNSKVMSNLDNSDIQEQIYLLKRIIFGSLFNVTTDEVESLIGIIGTNKIDSLIKSIEFPDAIFILDRLKLVMRFLENVFAIKDVGELKEIARFCNEYYNYPNVLAYYRSLAENIVDVSKDIYERELNANLTKVDNDSKYIEYDEDSRFLAHVMNAFGSGSTLEDFKKPRFIGKTYICLTAIGKGVEPYSRPEIDMNHVTLLFDHIESGSLISMSNRDMYSQGRNGELNVHVRNNFYPLNGMLDNTEGIPNEYVVYREVAGDKFIYPTGVLVVGDEPSEPEKAAAEYLGVPLIKRAKVAKEKKNENIEANITNEEFNLDKIKEILSALNSLRNDLDKDNVLA